MSTDADEQEVRNHCLRHQVPFAKLDGQDIATTLIDAVPREVAIQWRVMPVAEKSGTLILASDDVSDPNARVIDASIDLRRRCQPALTTRGALQRALERYYGPDRERSDD